jgi:predicted transcriptional regulator
MPKNTELSTATRAQIVAFSECGMLQIDIANRLNVSQSVISRTLKIYGTRGTFSSRKRSGRPKITTSRTDSMIRRQVLARPMITAREISTEICNAPSIRTIQRRLHTDFNLKARRPAKKPLLSAKNITDRLAFCRKYQTWTTEMWRQVLFSDESQFHQVQQLSTKVRRPPNTRYQVKYIQPTVRHSPSVMVWACFSGSGIGALWFLPTNETMRAGNYLEVLQEHLVNSMQRLGCTHFQQDGAPCHTAKLVTNWLRLENVNILDWPGQSPDLNPIENLWMIVKRKVSIERPTSASNLKEIIAQVWSEGVYVEECQNLCDSMPRRIKAVLRNKGYHSKY